jgi:hypothetical protein
MGARCAGLGPRVLRVATELVLGAAGLSLIAGAVLGRGWLDRHVMLPFFFGPDPPAWLVALARGAAGVGGVLLLLVVRPRFVRRLSVVSVDAGSTARTLVAALASVLAMEVILRVLAPGPASGSARYELKVGQWHPRFGWISRPSAATTMSAGGRRYLYAVNAQGLRAPAPASPADLSRPTLVVTGESIANGFGLAFEETFAARCGRDLGLEVVNVAEGGYGLDQAYLRLRDVLPRLQRPTVVVTVFVGPELGRLERDDRPRLVMRADGALQLVPRATGLFAGTRLHDVFHNRLAYLGEAALERGLRLAAALLQSTAQAARDRGAQPLFVLPSVGPARSFGQHRERELWQRLLVDQNLPYVVVDLPVEELIPGDRHPGPAGARRIAAAIEATLRDAPLQASGPRGAPP